MAAPFRPSPDSAGAAVLSPEFMAAADRAGVDRISLFDYDFPGRRCLPRGLWIRAGRTGDAPPIQALSFDDVPQWDHESHRRGLPLWTPDVPGLAPGPLRSRLGEEGAFTSLSLPLMGKKGCGGFVTLAWTRALKTLGLPERRLLGALANLLLAGPPREPGADQAFLDRALHEAIELTGSSLGYIYHYREDTREFVLNSWSRQAMAECRVVEPQTLYHLEKTGMWGEVVRQRRPIIVNDFQAPHPHKKGYPEGHVALRSFMSLPVLEGGAIVGVLGLANKPGGYGEEDLELAGRFMAAVWSAQAPAAPASGIQAPAEAGGEGPMILLVDDEPDLLEMVAQALEAKGYRVRKAAGPEEALRLAGPPGRGPDLLLTDVIMPGMDGGQLALRLRGLLPGLRCIYMSGYTADVLRQKGVAEQGMRLLAKPFSLKELYAQVQDALGQPGPPAPGGRPHG